MLLPDVNVLIYAAATDAVDHRRYHQWLDDAFASEEGVVLVDVVIAGFIRITTNPRLSINPPKTQEAIDHIQNMLARTSCIRLQPGDRHLPIFASICKSAGVKGPMVTDAWLAAIAIEHGCELVTTDRDFSRFPGLKWRHPLD